MLSNKFSTKNKNLYKNRCMNLRDAEYTYDDEEDTSLKIERFLPTKK